MNQNDGEAFAAAQANADPMQMQAPMNVGFVTGTQNQGFINDAPGEAEPDEDVTLDSLTPEEKDKILRAYKAGRDAANSYYRSEVEPKIIRRMELYKVLLEAGIRRCVAFILLKLPKCLAGGFL